MAVSFIPVLLILLIGGALVLALVVGALSGHKGSRHLLAGLVIVIAAGLVISFVFIRTSMAHRNAAIVERMRAEQARVVAHAQARAQQNRRSPLTETRSAHDTASPMIQKDVRVAMEAPPHLTDGGLVVGGSVRLDDAAYAHSAGMSGGGGFDSRRLEDDVRHRIAEKLSIYFEQLTGLPSAHGRGLVDEVADSVERVMSDVKGNTDQLYELRASLRQLSPATRRRLADQIAAECGAGVLGQHLQTTDPKTGRATEVYATRITVPPQRISNLADTLAAESRPRGVTVRRLAVFTAGALLVALVILKVATRRHRRRHGL